MSGTSPQKQLFIDDDDDDSGSSSLSEQDEAKLRALQQEAEAKGEYRVRKVLAQRQFKDDHGNNITQYLGQSENVHTVVCSQMLISL